MDKTSYWMMVPLLAAATLLSAQGTPGETFPLLPGLGPQEHPAMSGSWVAWQEFNNERGDYDIVVADANRVLEERLVFATDDPEDQMYPTLWDTLVAWQEFSVRQQSQDWDVFMADTLGDEQGDIWIYPVSAVEGISEQRPAIHGNTVVWEDEISGGVDIYGADISFLNDIRIFPVAVFDGNQATPAIWRDQVLWQDDFHGDWDIYLSDIWLTNWVTEQPLVLRESDQIQVSIGDGIAVWQDNSFGDWDIVGADLTNLYGVCFFTELGQESDQMNPAVSGGIVVYQDNRNGNWDIYAMNLYTGLEQRLTKHKTDQVNPAISGNRVVWQDSREGDWRIYCHVLDGFLGPGDPHRCPR